MSAGVKNLRLFFASRSRAKKGLKVSTLGSLTGLTGFNKKREKAKIPPPHS